MQLPVSLKEANFTFYGVSIRFCVRDAAVHILHRMVRLHIIHHENRIAVQMRQQNILQIMFEMFYSCST